LNVRKSFDSLAIFAATLRASSFVSKLPLIAGMTMWITGSLHGG